MKFSLAMFFSELLWVFLLVANAVDCKGTYPLLDFFHMKNIYRHPRNVMQPKIMNWSKPSENHNAILRTSICEKKDPTKCVRMDDMGSIFGYQNVENHRCLSIYIARIILIIFGRVITRKKLADLSNKLGDGGNFDPNEMCKFGLKSFVEDPEAIKVQLKEVFTLYDDDGLITTEKLRKIQRNVDPNVTPEKLDLMIQKIDSDGSGTVDFNELSNVIFAKFDQKKLQCESIDIAGTILISLGFILKNKMLDNATEEVDFNHSKFIEPTEFCALAARFLGEGDSEAIKQELRQIFFIYDNHKNGVITTKSLREILHELDEELTYEELDVIIQEIHSNNSGLVDLNEFMEGMTGESNNSEKDKYLQG